MALGVGVPIPTIATAGVRLVPDLTGFAGAVRAGGIDQATVGARGASAAIAAAAAAAVAFGAVSVGAAKKAGDAFTDYEQSLVKIETLVGINADVVDEWGERILALGPEVGRGPQELADALFFVASAGLRGEEAFGALEASARAAALGLGDTATIADAVTSAVNAYGSEALAASEATDILVKTVEQGKVEADSLAASIGRVIPIASEAGVEFDQVGAAIAALTRTGLDAEEAATALRQLFNNIVNPSSQAVDALDTVGLTAQDLRESLRTDLLGTLELLRENFAGNTEALFNLIPNIRAVTGFLSLMGSNAESTRGIFAELGDAVGTVDERTAILAESNAFRREQARAAIEAAFIGEGEGSADAVTRLYESLADILPGLLPDLVDIGEALLDATAAAADFGSRLVDIRNELKEPLGDQDTVGGFIAKLVFGDLGNNINAITSDIERQQNEILILDEYVRRYGAAAADILNTPIDRAAAQGIAASSTQRDILFNTPPDIDPADLVAGTEAILAAEQAARDAAAAMYAADDGVGTLSEGMQELRGPDGTVVVQIGNIRDRIAEAVEETGNLSSALLALTDPGFAAIESVEAFREAYEAALDPESEGGETITDVERSGLLRPFLEVQARIDELDPTSATIFRDTITEAWQELGGEAEDVFGEGGVIPLHIDEFGRVMADIGPDVVDNADGWGADLGGVLGGELDDALRVVKGRLGIDSPSSVWAAEVGRPIADGIAQGIYDGIPAIVAALDAIPDPGPILSPTATGGTTVVVNNPTGKTTAGSIQTAAAQVRAGILR